MRITAEERRQQILDVALGLCAEKGFSGTTLDDIADGAGVSRALVVQHFGSKEGVYDALYEAVARAHPLEDDPEIARCIEEKDDFGVFRACAAHVFENNLRDARQSNLRLTIYSMLENTDLFHKFAEVRDGAWEGVISYLDARKEEGALDPVNSRELVEGFRAMVVHLAAETMYKGARPDRAHFYGIVDSVVELILQGLRCSAGEP
ncbi:MAG TPA: TetR/AcrR family transcriptional regulator [Chloroflexi bacterium]|nr:TetR/AcrR family transcriptional regulator [Chloroflexota bacterium]